MFGNQLAMFSLLLLGLNLSSNLSEAVRRSLPVLFALLNNADNHVQLREAFQELGGDFQIYADLAEVVIENCTPERILFANPKGEYLGEGAQAYVNHYVNEQRLLCEQTFFQRLHDQYAKYKRDWPSKIVFVEFVNFVQPWPRLDFETLEIADWIPLNIEAYMDWREHKNPRPMTRSQIYNWVRQSNYNVYEWLAGFASSLRANPNFRPELDWEQAHAIVLGMIAEAVKVVTDSPYEPND